MHARARALRWIAATSLLIAAGAEAIVFPEVPLDPTVQLVPSYRSEAAAIASNGHTMMAVSAGSGVSVIRIDEQGRILDPLGITLDRGSAREAGIAWNGHHFIVQTIRSDGHLITYPVSDDGSLQAPPVDQGAARLSQFSLASNGRDVLLTWDGQSHFVGPDGHLEGPPISTPGETAVTVVTGNEFRVFTTQPGITWTNPNRIYMWRIDRTGLLPSGEPIETGLWPNVAAAVGRDRILIAWSNDDQTANGQPHRRLWTVLLDSAGHTVRSTTVLYEITSTTTSVFIPADPAASFDGNEFMVMWFTPGADVDANMAQRFTLDGSPSGEPFVIEKPAWARRNGIAVTDDGHVATVSYRNESYGLYKLQYPILRFASSFAAIAAAGHSLLLSDAASQQGLVLSTASSGAFAAWTEGLTGAHPGTNMPSTRNIMAAEIDSAFKASTPLTLGRAEFVSPKVATTAEGHTVFWNQEARRISVDGQVIDGPPFEMQTTTRPWAVAWHGSTYYTAWMANFKEIEAARLTATGKRIDYEPHKVVTDDGVDDRLIRSFLSTPSALFITWWARPSAVLPSSQFWIGRMGADLQLAAATHVDLRKGVDDAVYPEASAAANDREILVAGNNPETACRHVWRLGFDLNAPAPGRDVLCSPPDRGKTIPVWDGAAWWLVYDSKEKPGIFAIRLADDLTAVGSPETITGSEASLAGAESAFNGFIVGYARPVEELGGSQRVFFRYVGPVSRRQAVRR